ncbi:MAG TPA: cell division protein FtsA [Selenomonadales bacterium]|nr:cell division protein FtsA [Selenomonadales bacterium]
MAKKCVLGVDVGTSSVKVLAGVIEADGTVRIQGAGTAPTEGFSKGTITDAEALASSVKGAIDCTVMAAAVAPDAIYLGLGGMDIVSVNSIGSMAPASADGISGEDIERACRAATIVAVPDDHRVLHVVPTGYWVDGQKTAAIPLGKRGNRLETEAHIISLPREPLEGLLGGLSASGIRVAGTLANCMVAAEAVRPDEDGACLVLDMGAGLTDLALYSDGIPRMTASLPLGGDYITGDIMQGLDVTRPHAEAVKRYYARLDRSLKGRNITLDCAEPGSAGQPIAYDFLFNIVESRVEELVAILHGYLEPVLSGYNVRTLILAGGCASLPSVGEAAAKIFGLPAQLARLENEVPLEYACPSNTACFGLIKYAAGLKSPEPVTRSSWRSLLNKFREYI